MTENVKFKRIRHAHCWEIITPKENFFPMLVLGTYFEPRFLEMFNKKEISETRLYNSGTGYVHAVGVDGRVKRLQYYEYSILKQGEDSERYKNEIMSKWKCENIEYSINQMLEKKRTNQKR